MSSAIQSQLLDRIISSGDAFSEQGAQELLTLSFPDSDRDRMNELAQKARDGELSKDEKAETENYELVGHLLSILKSKARQTLSHAK